MTSYAAFLAGKRVLHHPDGIDGIPVFRTLAEIECFRDGREI